LYNEYKKYLKINLLHENVWNNGDTQEQVAESK